MILKLIRWFLGHLILFLDRTFKPRSIQRTSEAQIRIDQETQFLILYQFEACPFCVKVRRAIKRMNLHIELRDAKTNPDSAAELVQGGGTLQVPCLRIESRTQEGALKKEDSVRWLYESEAIIAFLQEIDRAL